MLLALATLVLAQASSLAEDPGPTPAGVLRVYLIRHGQAYSNLNPAPDLPPAQLDRLTELGRAQARRAGGALAGRDVALILTSPAGRARETAEELHRDLPRAEVRLDARLRPLERGRSPTGAELSWDERVAEWKAGRDPAPLGGESLQQVGLRVLELVRQEHRAKGGRSLVLVAHSDVVGPSLSVARGDAGLRAYPFAVRNGSVSLVEVGGDGAARVVFTDQLPEERLPPP